MNSYRPDLFMINVNQYSASQDMSGRSDVVKSSRQLAGVKCHNNQNIFKTNGQKYFTQTDRQLVNHQFFFFHVCLPIGMSSVFSKYQGRDLDIGSLL